MDVSASDFASSRGELSPSRTHIVVNADDFGLDETIDAGIIACCESGAVRSVSAATVGASFERSIGRLVACSGIDIGVHLCLTDERPLSPASRIPTLCRADGRFRSHAAVAGRLLFNRLSSREVYLEWDAQVRRLLAHGIRPTHLDTHNHLHLFPPLFRVLVHLAEKYGIPFVRVPRAGGFSECGGSARGWLKNALALLNEKKQLRELRQRRIGCADAVFGFLASGSMDEAALRRYVDAAPAGRLSEIICHPGNGDCARYAAWHYRWRQEKDALAAVFGSGSLKPERRPYLPDAAAPRMEKVTGISVVIPAYNECENLAKLLAILERILPLCADDHEILVIDDRSDDGTGELEKSFPGGRVKIVPAPAHRGYGASLRHGLSLASKEWIFYTDADYPVHLDHLREAVACCADCDMIIGARTNSADDGLLRRLQRAVYGTLVRGLFRVPYRDINFAFKLLRRSALQRIPLSAGSGFLDAELLIRVHAAGLRVRTLPMETLQRTFGASRLSTAANVGEILRDLVLFYCGRHP